MRLLAITIGTLVVLSMALLSVRFWGLAQRFQPYDHIVYKQKTPLIFSSGTSYFNIDTNPQTGEFLVGNTPLSNFLDQIRSTCSVLNFKANLPAIHNHIEKYLSANQLQEASCLILRAETRNVTKALKQLLPRYVYSSTPAENMKLISMQAMGLLPAAEIQSDLIFIEPYDKHGRTLLSDDLAQEIARQYKKIIVGPFKAEHEGLAFLNQHSNWSIYGIWIE